MNRFNRFFVYPFILSLLFISGCSNKSESHQENNEPTQEDNRPKLNSNADVESVLSIIYQQQAAEYRALCFQAYNISKRRVDEAKNIKNGKMKKFAIITDLDETALDNSSANAWLYLHDSATTFPFLLQWWLKGMADSVPGSVSFFNYVYSKGIDIYYISNRTDSNIVVQSTMKNMHKLGFPYSSEADTNHFLFLKTGQPSSKESRRRFIENMDSVIAFLGDNLIDLDSSFDGKSKEIRRSEVDRLKNKWGERYIVFPNSIYGDWESRLYSTSKLTMYQKDSVRSSILNTYR